MQFTTEVKLASRVYSCSRNSL